MLEKEPATYVANVRVSIKHLASIALFYNSQNEHKGTLSKLASAIIISGAELTAEKFPVETISKAVDILTNLCYEDLYKAKAKHNKGLFRALGMEYKKEAKQDTIQTEVEKIMAQKRTVVSYPTAATQQAMTTTAPEEISEETPREPYDMNKVSKAPMTAEEVEEATIKNTTDAKIQRKEMDLGKPEVAKDV